MDKKNGMKPFVLLAIIALSLFTGRPVTAGERDQEFELMMIRQELERKNQEDALRRRAEQKRAAGEQFMLNAAAAKKAEEAAEAAAENSGVEARHQAVLRRYQNLRDGVQPSEPRLESGLGDEQTDRRNIEVLQAYGDALDRYDAFVSQSKQPASSDEAEQEKAFDAALYESKKLAVRYYGPAVNNQNSPLSKKATEIAKRLEAQGNDLVFQSDAPLKIYQMAANELGIAPKP